LWAQFFQAREEEEFDMLAKQDPAIGAAFGKLKELSQDEALQMLAEIAANGAMGRGFTLAQSTDGREEGRKEALLDMARRSLSEKLTMETIQTLTGLSRAEILALQTESATRH
jgi:predicted transposase YdaD